MRKTLRIASLLAAGTEILYGLGLGEEVVAVSHECDFPSEVATKPRVTHAKVNADAASGMIDAQVRLLSQRGEPLYEIDAQTLSELHPDLIVTQAQCDVCAVHLVDVQKATASCPALAKAQLVAINPSRVIDTLDDISKIGEAAGVSLRADKFVRGLTSRVDRVRDRTAGLSVQRRPRVCCVEWLEPVMLAANWMPELIAWAGGQCALTAPGAKSAIGSWEEIVRFDPEVIVLMPCGFDLRRTVREAEVLRNLPDWRDITAVATGRVFAVDGAAFFNRSGPRLVDSLEILAAILHPNLFAGHSEVLSQAVQVWS